LQTFHVSAVDGKFQGNERKRKKKSQKTQRKTHSSARFQTTKQRKNMANSHQNVIIFHGSLRSEVSWFSSLPGRSRPTALSAQPITIPPTDGEQAMPRVPPAHPISYATRCCGSARMASSAAGRSSPTRTPSPTSAPRCTSSGPGSRRSGTSCV
jgi:hypothetical protein